MCLPFLEPGLAKGLVRLFYRVTKRDDHSDGIKSIWLFFLFVFFNSDNQFASYTVVNKRPHNIFPVYLDLYYLSFDLFNE